VLDQPLRRLTQAAVELCATAEAAASHRSGPLHPDSPIVSELARAADERDVGDARARLRDSMAAFDRGEELPEPNIACRLWSDPVPAILIGIRSALAVGITSAIWFATAWPNGPAAIIVAAVLVHPARRHRAAGQGQHGRRRDRAHRSVPGFRDPVLPDAAGRRLSFDGGRARTVDADLRFHHGAAAIGPLGLLSAVYFAFASNIDNVMTYDAAAFLNSSLAILVGIAVAVVLFATFFPRPRPRGSSLPPAARCPPELPRQRLPLRPCASMLPVRLIEQLGTRWRASTMNQE